MVLPSFLLDPRVSDQIFSSSTLLSQDSCSASPGYDTLGFVLKAPTILMVDASPMEQEPCHGSGVALVSSLTQNSLDISLVLTLGSD